MSNDFIDLSDDFDDFYFETPLSKTLDKVLASVRNEKHKFAPCIPIVGLTGSGKTSVIKSWLKHYKLKNLYISGLTSLSKVEVEYYPNRVSDLKIQVVSNDELVDLLTPKKKTVNVLFSSKEIDEVDDQTIIVIDDYDRAPLDVREELFNLIGFQRVVDPRVDDENKIKIVNPLMFIVVLDYSNLKVLSEKELKLFGLDKNN
jgi:MoxR-like ATPase